MASQMNARLVFDNARNLIQSAGFSVNQAILSQSYIRSEVLMSTSVTNYHLPILVNDNQNNYTSVTMNLLNLQDAFVVSSIGIFVAAPATSTTTAFPLYTYPNSVVFSTAGAASALYNLYNGQLQLTVNNRQIMPSWDIYRHLWIGQSQQGIYTGTANTGLDQNDGSESGYYPVEPNIVLVGSKNNQLNIQLPAAIGTLQASAAPKIVVVMRGLLCQNVTPVR